MQKMTIVTMAAMLVAAPAFAQGSHALAPSGARCACGAGQTGGGRVDTGITLGGGAGAASMTRPTTRAARSESARPR